MLGDMAGLNMGYCGGNIPGCYKPGGYIGGAICYCCIGSKPIGTMPGCCIPGGYIGGATISGYMCGGWPMGGVSLGCSSVITVSLHSSLLLSPQIKCYKQQRPMTMATSIPSYLKDELLTSKSYVK